MEKNLQLTENNEKKTIFLPKLAGNYESNKGLQEFVDHKPTERLKDDEEQAKTNDLRRCNLIAGKK